MKIGNRIIHISLIEVLGSIIAIAGVVLFFILEDELLRILSICASAVVILALLIKFNNKFNTIVTNQFDTSTHSERSIIRTESQTPNQADNNDNNYEEVQINNKGFVIVNRSDDSSVLNIPPKSSPMHAYNIDESDNYEANTKSYTIVPADNLPADNEIDAQQEAETIQPPSNNSISIPNITPAIEQTDDDIQPTNMEKDINSIDTIEIESNEQNTVPLFTQDEHTSQTPNIVTQKNIHTSVPTSIVNENELATTINEVIINPIEATKHNDAELHVSNILEQDNNTKSSLKELNKIIAQLLVLLGQHLRYTTAGVVWVNHEKQILILDNYVCEGQVKDFIIEKFDANNNKFTEIINTSKPSILTEKYKPEAEQQYFPYYNHPIGIKSFIGIPIIYEDIVTAILFIDTDKYKYSEAEYLSVKSFEKIFSSLIASYKNRVNDENSAKILEVINDFSTIISSINGNVNEICSAITNFVQEHYICSNVGVVIYNINKGNWTVHSYKSVEPVQKQFLYEPINLSSSLIGASITKSQPALLSSVPIEFIRVNEYEPRLSDVSFISIPIKSITNYCYGALFIENTNSSLISSVNVKILETVCNQAGEMLEKFKWMRLFDNYVETEIDTEILTQKAFHRCVKSEVARATDSEQPLILILVTLDEYSYFADTYKKTQISHYIIELLKMQIKSFEVIGRVTNDVVGMLLFNRNTHQVKLLMDSINKKLATQYIEIQKEKLSATISVGINALAPKDTLESFTTNATTALRYAQQKTNCVQIFQ